MGRKSAEGKALELRRRRFFAALALAGMTQEDFADKHGVTGTQVYFVLRGERESRTLDEKIDAFISDHLPVATTTVA